jgi:hypothetical protein
MRQTLRLVFLMLVLAACSRGEKATELSSIGRAKPAAPPPRVDLAALQKCCDANARAMDADCCRQLDQFMQAQSGMMGGGPAMRTGRPVQMPPEIVAQWPRVKLRVGPKNAAGSEVVVGVGEKKKLAGTPLEIEVLAFVPAFKMTGDAVITEGAEATNPAAKVIIREAGKPDWTGWLFANMPDVHRFEHDIYQVILLAGIRRE